MPSKAKKFAGRTKMVSLQAPLPAVLSPSDPFTFLHRSGYVLETVQKHPIRVPESMLAYKRA